MEFKGERFSWHVFSRNSTGFANFFVKENGSDQETRIPLITGISIQSFQSLSFSPDMIDQYVEYLKSRYSDQGVNVSTVRTEAFVALNGRSFMPLIASKESSVPVIFPHPDQQQQPTHPIIVVGSFFIPEYQLAVVDNEGLLPEDSSSVARMKGSFKILSERFNVSSKAIANFLLLLRSDIAFEDGSEYSFLALAEEVVRFSDAFTNFDVTLDTLRLQFLDFLAKDFY